jgi:hypothetical protein
VAGLMFGGLLQKWVRSSWSAPKLRAHHWLFASSQPAYTNHQIVFGEAVSGASRVNQQEVSQYGVDTKDSTECLISLHTVRQRIEPTAGAKTRLLHVSVSNIFTDPTP